MDREWEIKQAIGCMWAKASMKPSVQCRLYQVDDHKSKAMVVNTSKNLQDSVIFVGVNSLPTQNFPSLDRYNRMSINNNAQKHPREHGTRSKNLHYSKIKFLFWKLMSEEKHNFSLCFVIAMKTSTLHGIKIPPYFLHCLGHLNMTLLNLGYRVRFWVNKIITLQTLKVQHILNVPRSHLMARN